MKLLRLNPDEIETSDELHRTGSAKTFEDRLRSSIEEIGLVEPLKVARQPNGKFLVIDGNLRLRAIRAIRKQQPSKFDAVAAYVFDYDRRFEIRFQSDVYQDLLPSQLATLVEHLHRTEGVLKADIARYIGVSPATLRNYTGLWRLLERGGLFARIVELMDIGVFPSSNPYAWLRLTDEGIRKVLSEQFCKSGDVDAWAVELVSAARLGTHFQRYPLKFVELVTAALPAKFYRHGEDVRAIKRDLGLRRVAKPQAIAHRKEVGLHLSRVLVASREPVLRSAARALKDYLS